MINVKWGWRVQCAAKDCKHTVEEWSEKGVPSLPWPGAYAGGPLKGWFMYHGRGVYRDGYLKGHVAYCPEHAHVGTEWLASASKWEGERCQVGKAVALTFLERVAEWLSPAEERRSLKRAAGNAVYEWDKTHPRPRPPWWT
jgi:hypothetical protein